MSKEKLLPISIFCLSISIIISSSIIAKGMKENGTYVNGGLINISQGLNNISNTVNYKNNNNSTVGKTQTFNLYTAAQYLGITYDKLEQIVSLKDSGIPYIKIGNEYIFSKSALDKWLETGRVEIK